MFRIRAANLVAWLLLTGSLLLLFPIPEWGRVLIMMGVAIGCGSTFLGAVTVVILVLAAAVPLPLPVSWPAGLRLVVVLALWGGIFSATLVLCTRNVWLVEKLKQPTSKSGKVSN